MTFEQGHIPLTSELKRSGEDRLLAGWRVTMDPRHVDGSSDVDIVPRSQTHGETIGCARDLIQVPSY